MTIDPTSAYAVRMIDDTMSPRFEPGELLYVNPTRPVRPGHDVVVALTDGWGLVKRLVRLDDRELVVEQLNPPAGEPRAARIPADQVAAVHRIVGFEIASGTEAAPQRSAGPG